MLEEICKFLEDENPVFEETDNEDFSKTLRLTPDELAPILLSRRDADLRAYLSSNGLSMIDHSVTID